MTADAPATGTQPERDDAWSRDPDFLEDLLGKVLSEGDMQAVEAVLRLMVVADPARAVRLYDELKDALVVARFLGAGR